MTIYKIYARNSSGDLTIISPYGANKDKEEMLKIAKRMKYDMNDTFKEVTLKGFEYVLENTCFIEV